MKNEKITEDRKNHRDLNKLNLDLLLAVYQGDEKRVNELLESGADANFEVPDNDLNFSEPENNSEVEMERRIEIHRVDKINDQTINISFLENGVGKEYMSDYQNSISILNNAAQIQNMSSNISISLIEAGADFTQTEDFNLLSSATFNNDIKLVDFLVKKGLEPHFSASSEGFSAFDIAYMDGNVDILNHFITKDFNPATYKMKNILVNNKNSETIKLLLNAGVIPGDDMISNICHATIDNITLLNEILKYDFIKNSESIMHKFNDFLLKGKIDFVKLIMENKTSMINYALKCFTELKEMEEIDNSLNDYIFIYQTTTNIINDNMLSTGDIDKFNNLLLKNSECVEIFLGIIKNYVLENGDSFFQKNDLIALFEKPSFLRDLKNLIPSIIFDKLVNDQRTGIFDILEQKYQNALEDLEEMLIPALNPELMLESTPIEEYKEFYQNNILAKDNLNYLASFFNSDSETALINGLVYLLQTIPGLVVAVRPIIEIKKINPDDVYGDMISQAIDLYYKNPIFGFNEDDGSVYIVGQSTSEFDCYHN